MNCFRCVKCYSKYYSATTLEHLANKYCEKCGGRLTESRWPYQVRSGKHPQWRPYPGKECSEK